MRRLVWGLALAAGLVGLTPSAGWAQVFTPSTRSVLTADEGTLDMDGALTLATVTLQSTVLRGFQRATATYAWIQLNADDFDAGRCLSGNALSSSDPDYVMLSGATGSLTTGPAEGAVAIGSPSFTAPNVAETKRLYFGVRLNWTGLSIARCYNLAVDIRDVQPPVVELGEDQSVAEGDTVTIRATTSGEPDGTGSVPISFLTLTSTTGPTTPSFTWVFSALLDPNDPTMVLQPAHSTSFTAPIADADYTLEFQVTVYDSGSLSATDTLTVTVTADNDAPVANAGPDQTVSEDDAAVVTLDGTGSSDPPFGGRLSYRWTQTSGPDVSFLGGGSIANPAFWPPQLTADTDLVFSLVVTDVFGEASAADTVTITITADNDAPQVLLDGQIVGHNQRVILLPSASDPEGLPLRYAWEQTSGTAVTLSSTTAQRPIFTTPIVGVGGSSETLEFRVTVTDSGGLTASATASVVVGTAGSISLQAPEAGAIVGGFVVTGTGTTNIRFNGVYPVVNHFPVVNAGPDQTVSEGSTVTLAGSGSDADGDTLIYTWKFFGAGESLERRVVLSDANAQSPTFTAPNLAVTTDLFFALVAEDERMGTRLGTASPPDVVRITVTASNEAPTVDAGMDQTVDEVDEVRLSVASASDPEDGSVLISWTQLSGPEVQHPALTSATALIQSRSVLVFSAPNLAESYTMEFEATAADLHGAVATDSVTISVTADNDAPVSVPGSYTAVAGGTVRMNGGPQSGPFGLVTGGSVDPDGGTLSYAWEQVLQMSEPDPGGGQRLITYSAIAADHADRVALAGADTATPSFTAPDRDVELFFRLTVTDPQGLTGAAVGGVEVVRAADAGDDLQAIEGVLVTLDGSESSDPDGRALRSYAWQQISGTPMVSLSDSTVHSPTFVAPDISEASVVLGFRLTITDSAGRSDSDEMQVRVNRAFTVAAGRVVYVDSGLSNCVDTMGNPMDCPQVPSVSPDSITLAEGTEGSLGVVVSENEDGPRYARSYGHEWEQTAGPPVVLPVQNSGGFVFLAPTPIAADVTLEFRVTTTLLTHPYGRALHNTQMRQDFLANRDPLIDVTAQASVQVRVTRDASAARPTANAGEDLTAVAGSRVTLRGSGAPATMGATLRYYWTQLSGDSVVLQAVDVSAGVARFSAPPQTGVLTFQLAVVEIGGTQSMPTAIGASDTMQVTLTSRAPVANAGTNAAVAANAAVMLDGSASSDPEGEALTYAWTQVPASTESQDDPEGTFPVALANADAAVATFTAPSLRYGTPLRFTLRVTNSEGGVSEDSVRILVQADPAYQNQPPVAHAGADMQVLPGATVTLDGRLSGDPNFAGLTAAQIAALPADQRPVLGYRWTQQSGTAVTFDARFANGATPSFTAPANAGSTPLQLVFRLVVSDGAASSAPDDVAVTVVGNADATLASLVVNRYSGEHLGAIQFSPAFDPDTASYSVPLANDFDSVVVTAVPRARGATAFTPDMSATGQLTGATVAVAGMDSANQALTVMAHMMSAEQFRVQDLSTGANTVTITVTAPDGTTTETYTLTVTRAAAVTGASTLAELILRTDLETRGSRSHGNLIALNPVFATATMAYTAQVPNQVTGMRIAWLRSTVSSSADASTAMIAAGSEAAASCTIDDMTGFLGDNSLLSGRLADCPLAVGANTLTLEITEPGGGTGAATTYTVTVTRGAPSTDATLSALSVSGLRAEVSPAFAPATTEYTAQVGGFAMDVLPVTSHEMARFVVSGTAPGGAALLVKGARASGAATRLTGLLEGENTITIRVYAEDSTCFAREADDTSAPSLCAAASDTATTLRVPDTASPTTTQDYTLRVTRIGTPPQIESVSATDLILFLAVEIAPLRFTNSGGSLPPGSWTVTPALPVGLSLDAETGTISGTPTTVQAAADYTVTAQNAWGESSVVLNIAVPASMRAVTVARVAETVAEDGTPGAAEFSLTMTGVSPTVDIEVAWTLSGADGAALPGAANADFGAPEGAGIAVAANGISGSATWATGATLPQTLTLRVPVLQDVLNEGTETLTLTLGALTTGGQPAAVSEVGLGDDASAAVTVSASDPISVTLARAAANSDNENECRSSGRLVSGQPACFTAELGATASTPLTLSIAATLGGTALTVPDVAVAMLATQAAVMLPATLIDAATAAASGEVMLDVSVSGVTGAPTGAMAEVATGGAASVEDIGVVGWELSISGAGQVGEGGALQVTVNLRGTDIPTALTVPWTVSSSAAVAADFARNADYECGAAEVGDMCVDLPAATLDFSGASDRAARTRTIMVQTAQDREDESAAPESFTVSFGTLDGAQAPAVAIADTGGTLTAAISDALRQLSVTHPTAQIDEDSVTAAGQTANAVFTITMRGTESPVEDVVVNWTLSSPGNTITLPAAAGLGRNVEARDVGGSRTGTVTFAARVTLPAMQEVRVPILQDALNEGAENLRLMISASENAGGRMPTTPDSITATLVAEPTADATVAASDDINLQVVAVPDDDGVLTPGEDARFRLSFGTTTVNGVEVPIVPSTMITVPLEVNVGGQTETINVPVAAEAPTATAEVPAATLANLRTMAGGGTPQITVNVGTITGVPSGAMQQVDMASLMMVQNMNLNVAQFGLRIAPQAAGDTGVAEAPEGGSYTVTFTLSGNAADLSAGGLTVDWSVAARAAMDGGREATPDDFGGSTAYTCRGSTSASVACRSFPSGTVTFNTGDASQTIEIFIFDDGDAPEGTTPEGFSVSLMALGGGDAGNTALASGSSLPVTLQVDIPALRADLSVADVSAGEGEDAVFVLTLGNFVGGSQTTRNVVVAYTVGATGDTAERGVDYLSAASGQATILAGENTGRIAIPLVRDGLLELAETFTLTLTQVVERGGGTIRFAPADVNAAGELAAVGTITDTADQQQRREARVGTLVSVLDRSSALHAADAISARIERGGIGAEGAQTASLSLAGRNLLGRADRSGGDTELGLALYGAAGLGGASAGLPGGGSGGAGVGSGSGAGFGSGGAAAFGGLGAGLAGGANMGARSELPSMAKLAGESAFNFNLAGWNWSDYSNATLWGSGGVTILKGSPVLGGAKLDYEGDSTSFFIGGENYLRNDVLAGVALGFSFGNLDFTDHAASGYRLTGDVESQMVSVHPYASWWLAPDMNVWLSLGYGTGTVTLSENIAEGGNVRRSAAETDQESVSVTAGATGRVPVLDDATSLALNFQITRVMSDLDAARFDNGAQLAKQSLRSTRIAGEAELGRDFALPIGATLRPFATAQVRLDLGDAVSQDIGADRDAAMDLGGGADLTWPDQGVTLRLSGLAQLNDTGHQEHRVGVDVNYDLGADGQGLTMALQSAFSARRSRAVAGTGTGAAGALGSGLGTGAGLGTGGIGSARLGAGTGVQQSLRGEIGYGMAFRQFGRSGLLTPYGRFNLGSSARWAAGLRLSEPRSALELGLEAALEGAAATGRSYDLLLTGRLRF